MWQATPLRKHTCFAKKIKNRVQLRREYLCATYIDREYCSSTKVYRRRRIYLEWWCIVPKCNIDLFIAVKEQTWARAWQSKIDALFLLQFQRLDFCDCVVVVDPEKEEQLIANNAELRLWNKNTECYFLWFFVAVLFKAFQFIILSYTVGITMTYMIMDYRLQWLFFSNN